MAPDCCQRTIDELNTELDQLLYAISHDLNAPLRAIDGFSQAVLEDYEDKLDEDGKDYLNRVRGGAKTINQYIEGLLLISRQSRGDLDPVETDLSALAREAGAHVALHYPDHSPEFVVEDGITVTIDPRLARILLEKLLDNGWKFTAKTENARIEFGSTTVDGEPAFFVRDNGVGFDMNYAKERLFGAFQRMHSQEEFPGIGVGLATAKRIVNRHSGRLSAESEPGAGTTIYCVTCPQQE